MIEWLRGIRAVLGVAVLAVLAYQAARRATGEAGKAKRWQDRAEIEAGSDIPTATAAASESLTKAREHAAKAAAASDKAKAYVDELAKRDRTMAEIVDGWRK